MKWEFAPNYVFVTRVSDVERGYEHPPPPTLPDRGVPPHPHPPTVKPGSGISYISIFPSRLVMIMNEKQTNPSQLKIQPLSPPAVPDLSEVKAAFSVFLKKLAPVQQPSHVRRSELTQQKKRGLVSTEEPPVVLLLQVNVVFSGQKKKPPKKRAEITKRRSR